MNINNNQHNAEIPVGNFGAGGVNQRLRRALKRLLAADSGILHSSVRNERDDIKRYTYEGVQKH